MATTGRYFYTPAKRQNIGMHFTLRDRIERRISKWRHREEKPDVYMVTGYFQPVYPRGWMK